ncbi:sensor histidine kinase [Streptosporangium sandarakinum]|uniref:sensor histidine kinase n=1 Tax=Streptosporangium sandarakinum TaxID=1260955 RepID=UPI0034385D36
MATHSTGTTASPRSTRSTASRSTGTTASLAVAAGGAWLLVVTVLGADQGVIWRNGLIWALGALAGLSFLMIGVVIAREHPRNQVGPLMVLLGVAWIPQQMLFLPEDPLWALALCGVWAGVACHLFLAFPTGRLGSLPHRVVTGLAYVTALVLSAAQALVRLPLPAPLRHIIVALDDSSWQATVLISGALLVLTVKRWRRASAAQHRAIAPVTGASIVATVAFAGDRVADFYPPNPLQLPAALIMLAAFMAVPLAYLAGLMRSRMDHGRVAELVVHLSRRERPDTLRDELAATLRDPGLTVGYWTAEQDRYVDADGRPVDLDPGPGRAVTRVDQGEAPLAVLVHDAALLEQPLLVEAACAAAALALENERLTADLRARLRQLAASRRRMLQWGEAERRRIERDLHDGVQQRLLSVAMTLGLAEAAGAGPGRAVPLIGEAKAAVLAALDDLRAVSHGIHPPVLTERGLAGAVKELAAVSPVTVTVTCDLSPAGPLPQSVETAAYYIVNEALANVTRHAAASKAWVRLAHHDGHLLVEVGDDGAGGADPARGSGLAGLADRAEANGGRLTIDSPPGEGTVLRVVLPCA